MNLDLERFLDQVGFEGQLALDGRTVQRFSTDQRRTRKSGWIWSIAKGDKIIVVAGDWSTGERWMFGRATAEIRQALAQVPPGDERKHAEAAIRAQQEWDAATPIVDMGNSYLARKHARSYGLRAKDTALLVPMYRGGDMVGLQKIYPDGQKRFTPGCSKKGAYFLIGEVSSVLCVAEGYATAASIVEATRLPALVAFDAGNLLPAAKQWREYTGSTAHFIWCADNDENGVGLEKATAAAKELGGKVVMPGDLGDFNDLHVRCGLQEVTAILDAALRNVGLR